MFTYVVELRGAVTDGASPGRRDFGPFRRCNGSMRSGIVVVPPRRGTRIGLFLLLLVFGGTSFGWFGSGCHGHLWIYV